MALEYDINTSVSGLVCFCLFILSTNECIVNLSCEHTCTATQHYNTFIICFIITAMKIHGTKADLILNTLLDEQNLSNHLQAN